MPMKNKTLHFLWDNRHFLEDLKKGYKKLLIFFFSGVLLLLYQQRFSIINIIIALFFSSLKYRKCRLLKIKLKSKKVVSFGFFLEEKEAGKIIKAIKEGKTNYE